MKKLLLFFFTISLTISAHTTELLAEETLAGTITVTVRWYDNTPGQAEGELFNPAKSFITEKSFMK